MIRWKDSPEMAEWMASFIPGHTEREIAEGFEERFGVRLTRSQIKNFKSSRGIRSGTHGGCFEPGHEPANKGRPWSEWMPEESAERCRATQFKEGQLPHNAFGRPVGFERVNRDGYVEVKVKDGRQSKANDNYRLKHRVVWERSNGRKLEPGEVVVFADRDKRNFDPENLVAVSMSDWAVISNRGIPYCDRETLEAAVMAAKVRRAACAAERRRRWARRSPGTRPARGSSTAAGAGSTSP